MASSFMSVTQTVSSKLCSTINSFSSYSCHAKNSRMLPTIRKASTYPCFRVDPLHPLHSNRRTLKHHTRAITSESDWKENKDDEKSDWEESEDDEKSDWGENKDDKKDYQAEETVLKLYSDIKNQNINGISEVIGDECQCFCNFFSKYRLFQGKKQVMAFFYWLITKLGNDIKIVVKPMSKDGMTVGVQWQLEWDKPHIQLGKGFSFHICHVYQGKLLIKNVEMFMEPIFHIEPLRLRTMAFAVSLAEKIVTYLRPAENTRRQAITLLLFALMLLAAVAFYFTQPRF